MPNKMVKSYADKTGKSVEQTEKIWQDAKAEVKDQYPNVDEDDDSDRFYALVTSVFKNMLGIEESRKDVDQEKVKTFKEIYEEVTQNKLNEESVSKQEYEDASRHKVIQYFRNILTEKVETLETKKHGTWKILVNGSQSIGLSASNYPYDITVEFLPEKVYWGVNKENGAVIADSMEQDYVAMKTPLQFIQDMGIPERQRKQSEKRKQEIRDNYVEKVKKLIADKIIPKAVKTAKQKLNESSEPLEDDDMSESARESIESLQIAFNERRGGVFSFNVEDKDRNFYIVTVKNEDSGKKFRTELSLKNLAYLSDKDIEQVYRLLIRNPKRYFEEPEKFSGMIKRFAEENMK